MGKASKKDDGKLGQAAKAPKDLVVGDLVSVIAEAAVCYNGTASRSFRGQIVEATDTSIKIALDENGQLTDWGRANGYKEPK